MSTQETAQDYMAFMAAVPHSEIENVKNALLEYDSCTQYLIALEVSPGTHVETEGEHMHFITNMTPHDYHSFSRKQFVTKYKLRGKALKDKPRQYGKLKKIHNIEKMFAYTVKDGNIHTNFSEKALERWKDLAFKVPDYKARLNDYIQYMKKNVDPDEINATHPTLGNTSFSEHYTTLVKLSVKYHLEKGFKISRFSIKNDIMQFIIACKNPPYSLEFVIYNLNL